MKRKLSIYNDGIIWKGKKYNEQLDGCDYNTFIEIINHIIEDYDYDEFDLTKEIIRDDMGFFFEDINCSVEKLDEKTFNDTISQKVKDLDEEEIKSFGFWLISCLTLSFQENEQLFI